MTTFGDLVTQTWSLLHSYTGVHEQATWLTAGCTDVATSLSVNNIEMISMGVAEIGEELVFVSAVDQAAGLTLAPFGRGYHGTTAIAHNANDMVLFDPMFPRVEIKRAINQVLSSLYPTLFQVKETTFTFTGLVATYELPADAEAVMRVRWDATGPSLNWPAIRSYYFDPASELPSGKAITLTEQPEIGRTVKVIYQANLAEFVNDGDTLADVGLPESCVDLLLYGAASRLIRFLGPSRLQLGSVENIARGQLIQSADPGQMANQMLAIFGQRLEEERKKLLVLHPSDPHYER